ncbi:MAG: helix-turn-helix transcriptional regulator [Clostridia bacterium]|nr:helix-turn-helix transcriptional regulator [Clostridia bacterium]
MININKVGAQIAALRKARGLTQAELGERLNVSFQAVSKWERAEALPDIGLLVDLAGILGTSVDNILTGGEKILSYRGKITVSDMREGIACIEKCGRLLGRDNLIYRCAVEGINEGMNTDIEESFTNDYIFECFVAEAIIQSLKAGSYIDLTDVKNGFRHKHFRDIVMNYAESYGMK